MQERTARIIALRITTQRVHLLFGSVFVFGCSSMYYSSRIRGQTVPLNVYYTDVCEHSPVFADLISTLVKKSRFSSFHHDINLLSPSPNAPMSITRQPTGRFGRNLNPSLGYDPSSTRRPIGVASPPPPRSFSAAIQTNDFVRDPSPLSCSRQHP